MTYIDAYMKHSNGYIDFFSRGRPLSRSYNRSLAIGCKPVRISPIDSSTFAVSFHVDIIGFHERFGPVCADRHCALCARARALTSITVYIRARLGFIHTFRTANVRIGRPTRCVSSVGRIFCALILGVVCIAR